MLKQRSGSCRPWRAMGRSCPHQDARAACAGTLGRGRRTKTRLCWTPPELDRRTRSCRLLSARSCRLGRGAHPYIRSSSRATAGSMCPCSLRQRGLCRPTTPDAGKIIRRRRHGGFSRWPFCGLRCPGVAETCSSRLPACSRRGLTSSRRRNGYQAMRHKTSHLRRPSTTWLATAGTCHRLPRTSVCRCMAASTSPGLSMNGRTCSGGLGVRSLRRPRREVPRKPVGSSKRRRPRTSAGTPMAPHTTCSVRCVLPSAPQVRCDR